MKTPAGYVQVSPWMTIANKQLELTAKFMVKLGLTPSARSRVAVNVPNQPKSWETEIEERYFN